MHWSWLLKQKNSDHHNVENLAFTPIRPTVYTNLSEKRRFPKMLLKPEKFGNTHFAL